MGIKGCVCVCISVILGPSKPVRRTPTQGLPTARLPSHGASVSYIVSHISVGPGKDYETFEEKLLKKHTKTERKEEFGRNRGNARKDENLKKNLPKDERRYYVMKE